MNDYQQFHCYFCNNILLNTWSIGEYGCNRCPYETRIWIDNNQVTGGYFNVPYKGKICAPTFHFKNGNHWRQDFFYLIVDGDPIVHLNYIPDINPTNALIKIPFLLTFA